MWQKDSINSELAEEYKEIIKENKMEDKIYYLYIQIAFSLVLVVTSFMLKSGNTSTFEYAKKGYSDFFENESYVENSFSYNTYIEKIQKEINSRYTKFIEVFNRINGK